MINTEFLQTISMYEITNSFLFIATITILFSLFALYITNDRRSFFVSFISFVITLLLSLLSLYIIFLAGISLNNRYYFVAWLPFAISFLNLLLLNLEYRRLNQTKGFDIDFVSRYHFNISLNLGLIISLFSVLVFVFIPRELAFIIAVSSLIVILSMTFTHLVVRRLLRGK